MEKLNKPLQEKFKEYLEVQTNYAVPTIEKWSKDLAQIADKDKELIAEGTVVMSDFNYNTFAFIDGKDFVKEMEKYHGKKIKIHVEVQEELPKFEDIIGLFKEEEK